MWSDCLRRQLTACMVDGVIALENNLGHRDDIISIGDEIFDNTGEGLRRVQGCVVKQDDAARLDLACHALGDIGGRQILPV